MSIKRFSENYAAYNLWVSRQLIDWLNTKSDEQINEAVPSSYPGILNTLKHCVETEKYWYSMMSSSQTHETSQDISVMNKDELFKLMLDNARALNDYIYSLTEQELNMDVKVSNQWFESILPRYEYLVHAINHNTYHRGQVVTMGRNTGITDAPMTDYNYFNVVKAGK